MLSRSPRAKAATPPPLVRRSISGPRCPLAAARFLRADRLLPPAIEASRCIRATATLAQGGLGASLLAPAASAAASSIVAPRIRRPRRPPAEDGFSLYIGRYDLWMAGVVSGGRGRPIRVIRCGPAA
eukprot:scaffold38822_cov31-Tisochrysis_lutea.AAC.1